MTSNELIAIDPGPTESAAVVYDGERPVQLMLAPTEGVLRWLMRGGCAPGGYWETSRLDAGTPLVIEQVRSYGMRVGADVFDTVHWTGRMHQAWESRGGPVHLVPRLDVKMHICHDSRAKDANVRQALIDRFGPTRREAMGTKRAPGPLYGVRSHLWAALALAVTFWEIGPYGGSQGLSGHVSELQQ